MKKEKLSAKQIQDLLAKFDPRYYSLEHVETIVHGAPQQTIELLKKTELSHLEELALVQKAPSEVVEKYICMNKGRGLSTDAQINLIKRGDEKLITCFMEETALGFSNPAETELIRCFRHASKKWWKKYLLFHKLKGSAEIALVDLHDIDFLNLYLDDNTLSNEAYMRILKTYTPEAIAELIKHPRFYLTPESQVCFVRKMREDIVLSYISKHSLWDSAQEALVEKGDHYLIMYYLDHHGLTSSRATFKLAKRANYEEFAKAKKVATFRTIDSDAEIAIINNPSDKLFTLLITDWYLSTTAQLALIQGGYKPKRHQRIMQYLSLKKMDDANVLEAIVKRGNSEEIKTCIERKCFSTGMKPLFLIKRGRKDEIELYLSIYHPEWKIPE